MSNPEAITCQVVLLQAEPLLNAPLTKLSDLLAQSIASQFHDPILVMYILTAPALPIPPQSAGGVVYESIVVPNGSPLAITKAVRDAILERQSSYTSIYLIPYEGGPDPADIGALVTLGVVLTSSPGSTPKGFGSSRLVTELLSPAASKSAESSEPTRRRVAKREIDRFLGHAKEKWFQLKPGAIEPQRCRLRVSLAEVAAMTPPELAKLPEAEQNSIARWARAATHRRVGVALGGSGAWGYAHVTLIQSLEARGVPIDMISGASAGSFVGGYYAAEGDQGLSLYVARALSMMLLIVPAMITSSSIEWMVEDDLGPRLLEELEVMFYPVATNLSNIDEHVFEKGMLAYGIRASSSAPGLFAPTIMDKNVYVDGAVINNVPVSVMEAMGAALVVASNALPPPKPISPFLVPSTAIGRLLQQLNPIARVTYLLESFALLFHHVGNLQSEGPTPRAIFSASPAWFPLTRTFNFLAAKGVMQQAAADPNFQETIDRAVELWEHLAQPRVPQPLASPNNLAPLIAEKAASEVEEALSPSLSPISEI